MYFFTPSRPFSLLMLLPLNLFPPLTLPTSSLPPPLLQEKCLHQFFEVAGKLSSDGRVATSMIEEAIEVLATYENRQTHRYDCVCTYTHKFACIHKTHTHTHAQTHTLTQTRTHAHAHTHTHTHTHTHAAAASHTSAHAMCTYVTKHTSTHSLLVLSALSTVSVTCTCVSSSYRACTRSACLPWWAISPSSSASCWHCLWISAANRRGSSRRS